MKKIVLASAAMGGAALVAFGASGTFAAFSDTAQSGEQSARAGTLYLTPQSTQRTSTVDVNNFAPGQQASYAFYVENSGTLPGRLVGTFRLLTDAENTCLPVENKDPSSDNSCTTGDDVGELAGVATVQATYGPVANQNACTAATTGLAATTGVGTLAQLNGQSNSQEPSTIPAGQGFCAVVTVGVPQTAGNNIQSDSTSFAIDYRLDQA